jgi:DNA-binding CsgD family transcriptional regulator
MKDNFELPVYKQFNLVQPFVESELDYGIAENFAASLRHLSSMSNMCFWIFDYFRNNFYYISENTDFFKKEDRLTVMENGYDYFIKNTHPNDILYLLSIHKAAWTFIRNLPADRPMTDYKICYTIRLRDVEGNFVPVNQQVKPIATDPRGNGWLSMGLFEIDHSNLTYLPYIIHTNTGEKTILGDISQKNLVNIPPILSEREIELLEYISKNMNQKDIASKLCISLNTLQGHRKSLYRKLMANNKANALKNAYHMGLFKNFYNF